MSNSGSSDHDMSNSESSDHDMSNSESSDKDAVETLIGLKEPTLSNETILRRMIEISNKNKCGTRKSYTCTKCGSQCVFKTRRGRPSKTGKKFYRVCPKC